MCIGLYTSNGIHIFIISALFNLADIPKNTQTLSSLILARPAARSEVSALSSPSPHGLCRQALGGAFAGFVRQRVDENAPRAQGAVCRRSTRTPGCHRSPCGLRGTMPKGPQNPLGEGLCVFPPWGESYFFKSSLNTDGGTFTLDCSPRSFSRFFPFCCFFQSFILRVRSPP